MNETQQASNQTHVRQVLLKSETNLNSSSQTPSAQMSNPISFQTKHFTWEGGPNTHFTISHNHSKFHPNDERSKGFRRCHSPGGWGGAGWGCVVMRRIIRRWTKEAERMYQAVRSQCHCLCSDCRDFNTSIDFRNM